MSIRLEMLQVARLAPKLLGESTALVDGFYQRQQCEDGGFRGRTDRSDLYYTVFALEGLIALASGQTAAMTQLVEGAKWYLRGFGTGQGLDFVHLCCLARCWASIENLESTSASLGNRSAGFSLLKQAETSAPLSSDANAVTLLRRVEGFRSADGGYNPVADSDQGTAYACFLALGAYQDLRMSMPEMAGLARCLQQLQTPDGAWTNELTPGLAQPPVGSTNASAAALTLLRHLSQPVDRRAADWLLARAHPLGGFLAMPHAPIPDLLSTATTLHALAGLQISTAQVRDTCLDFIDSLWTNDGGFYGHWQDEHLDCEYTYYGLLALGHLSLA